MQRSLYEMDIENSINRAKNEGVEEGKAVGIAEGKIEAETAERIAFIQGLIRIGQSHEQIIDFLVKVRHFTVEQAENYYQTAIRQDKTY